ncbi:conserved hypothetical protein [Desulfamplus magnetovallimortis]|uniref:PIN domain-containing protein n=2 Tax=Desulfamplus magnetovallimortis TaxID=1246637 RepID=A0A1W1H7R0_9BACT|nr:conserved hypothetical protein [Desulfamplus magnetovallimortis]
MVSPEIIKEYWRVLHYPKIVKRLEKMGIPISTAESILKNFNEIATVTLGDLEVKVIADDPTDDKFLSCAVEGEADFIVSGDDHLLSVKEFQGIRILTPQAFLEMNVREYPSWPPDSNRWYGN